MMQVEIDQIYRNMPHEEIPWNIETPPDVLVELVENRKVKPCKTIDLGCGAGNYAIYLASMGFDVTGIDISPEKRKKYVENVYRILNPGGKYLSVCFSEKDPLFGGSGKYRETVCYYYSGY